jgi:hypothetical protein
MERFKSENDALIFVNKELGRINDELKEKISSNRRSQSREENDDSDYEVRPRKKTKAKQRGVEKKEPDEDARVCIIFNFLSITNFTKFFFIV